MGLCLWLRSTRFNHLMSAFPFMDSFRGSNCLGLCKCVTWLLIVVHLALGSDPQMSKIFRRFFQLLCQKCVVFSPQPKICILTAFLYLVHARWICSGLYISIWALVGLCCLCVLFPQGKVQGPFFSWRICVWRPDVLLCVSLLKFRLCLITRKHGCLAFSDILHSLRENKRRRVVWPWEQCPMSGVSELFSHLLRPAERGCPGCRWAFLASTDLHLCRGKAKRKREAERPSDSEPLRWALVSIGKKSYKQALPWSVSFKVTASWLEQIP